MNQVTAGSLVHVDGARVDLVGVRFDRNLYDASEGIIFVGALLPRVFITNITGRFVRYGVPKSATF